MKNHIIIKDWIGNILFEGYKDSKVIDKILDANRCSCCLENSEKDLSSQDECLQCDDTGYIGDFAVYWVDENDDRNVYEFINY